MSGSTMMCKMRIRVRTMRREVVIKVIVAFIRRRWEEKLDVLENGTRRLMIRDRAALAWSSLLFRLQCFNFKATAC